MRRHGNHPMRRRVRKLASFTANSVLSPERCSLMQSPIVSTTGLANGAHTAGLNGTRADIRPMSSRLSQRVLAVPPSGIRKYFDIAATMEDVVSLGIGEPDFVTPPPILQAGLLSLQRGHTSYTSNSGMYELREAVARNLRQRYGAVP